MCFLFFAQALLILQTCAGIQRPPENCFRLPWQNIVSCGRGSKVHTHSKYFPVSDHATDRRLKSDQPLLQRLLFFITPFDHRYEDLKRDGRVGLNVFHDFVAGLVVAMVAIPLAMGFAMASGLRPEQGIVGGAVAGLVGALFGGSKYQVYGPTAAFIPVIAGIMATHDHSMVVLAALIAGAILMIMGVARLGRFAAKVPHSIVVGFTVGIAVVIVMSMIGDVFGLKAKLGYGFFGQIEGIATHIGNANLFAILIAAITFVVTKCSLKVSVYLPGPLLALGLGILLASTIWADKGLILVKDKYGVIPTDLLVFTGPSAIEPSAKFLLDLAYYVAAIVFVSAVESLLCSRMADRLAKNKGHPYDPNKELWTGPGSNDRTAPKRFPAHGRARANRDEHSPGSYLAARWNLQICTQARAGCLSRVVS